MPGSALRPPLFERLASPEVENDAVGAFDREALTASIRAELLRLLNTRRSARPLGNQLSILDYGIADWASLQGQRGDDRRLLAREIRIAITQFEPRLQLADVETTPLPGQPQRLQILLHGSLRGGQRLWPVTFVVEPGNEGFEVRHERLD